MCLDFACLVSGDLGAVNFVWEISRFKLAAKFRTQNPGASAKLEPAAKLHRACKALQTTTFLGVSAKCTTQNPGASTNFPAAKFTTANLFWHAIPPPLVVSLKRNLTKSAILIEGVWTDQQMSILKSFGIQVKPKVKYYPVWARSESGGLCTRHCHSPA